MARRGVRLPYDGRNGVQQVGIFETADPDEGGVPLYHRISIDATSGTGQSDQITIAADGRYSIKADIDFHIETIIDPSQNAPDVLVTSPLVESGERILSFFIKGAKIKARRAGSTDGTLWVTPN